MIDATASCPKTNARRPGGRLRSFKIVNPALPRGRDPGRDLATFRAHVSHFCSRMFAEQQPEAVRLRSRNSLCSASRSRSLGTEGRNDRKVPSYMKPKNRKMKMKKTLLSAAQAI